MFTVIIADNEHIKKMKKNILFRDVFQDDSKFVFCPWNVEEKSLELALPTLYESVGKRSEWRAILFTDKLEINTKNPFDIVRFKADNINFTKGDKALNCELTEEEKDANNKAFNDELSKRKEAYDKAVKDNKISVLLQMLCNDEKAEEERKLDDEMAFSLDDSASKRDDFYKMYLETKKYKEDLIREYLIKDSEIVKPSEVLCLSPRTFENDQFDLIGNWEPLDEIKYSKFCEYNLYPSTCRFAVFDIVEDKHLLYKKYYLQLMIVIYILATNEIPRSATKPDKLYRITSKYNDKAFGELFNNYEKKLSQSCMEINRALMELQRPAEFIDLRNDYESKEKIDLNLYKYFNPQNMDIHYSGIRLSDNHPDDEEVLLDNEEHKSRKDTIQYLKQPRRIVSEGVRESLKYDEYDEDEILELDKFKIDDLNELANDSELQMSKIKKRNVFDTKVYKERLNERAKDINTYASKRMSLKKIMVTILIVLGSLLLPSMPFIIKNVYGSKAPAYNLEILLWVAITILVVAIIPLIIFRVILGFRVKDYNSEIASMKEEVEEEVEKVGKYLSFVKTLRKCKRVKEIFSKGGIVKRVKINNLKRHKNDILNHIQLCENLLSDLYTGYMFDQEEVEGYGYDFTADVKYEYPLPIETLDSTEIDFVYEGNKIKTPVNFLDNIIITREDIYD